MPACGRDQRPPRPRSAPRGAAPTSHQPPPTRATKSIRPPPARAGQRPDAVLAPPRALMQARQVGDEQGAQPVRPLRRRQRPARHQRLGQDRETPQPGHLRTLAGSDDRGPRPAGANSSAARSLRQVHGQFSRWRRAIRTTRSPACHTAYDSARTRAGLDHLLAGRHR